MQKINLFNIYIAFFKIGLILLGGGYVIVPVVEDVLVQKRNWLKNEELVDFYCVAQCLPGIVAINTSILIGHKLLGIKGAIMSVAGICSSPVVSIIIIAKFLNQIDNIPFIESVFWGVNISVIVLIYLALKDMWKKSMADVFCYAWFFIILILSLLKINPAILIISSIFVGFLIQKIKDKRCE